MGKTNHADHQTLGDVILERLSTTTVPGSLKSVVGEFRGSHRSLLAATRAAESARADRDAVLAAVIPADDALDAALLVLADKLVGAELGTRRNPFAAFSKYAPSALTNLPYAVEAKEVGSLVAKIKKAKPTADVAKSLATCTKLAAAVTSALSKVSKPQLAYQKALAARDTLLPAWTKSLAKLKRHAAAVWFEDPATFKAVFAAPERIQAPAKGRAKSAPAKPNGAATGTTDVAAAAAAGGTAAKSSS